MGTGGSTVSTQSGGGGSPQTGGSLGQGGVNSGTTSPTSGGTTTHTTTGTNASGASTSGGSSSKGGASSTGGTSSKGGTSSTGGTSSKGGSSATGGTATGGTTGSTTCPDADPAEFALVQAWLHNTTAKGALPSYAYNNIATNFPAGVAFNQLACSIAASCKEFAPNETNWVRKCEAVLASAIVAESSYNPASVVTDTYATRSVNGTTANDPTVGLLQIRFSSTVHDYNYYGSIPKMTAIGCNWPTTLTTQADDATFWATKGGTTHLSFMQDVTCNVALGAWYYFYNATGNGGSAATWIADYCGSKGGTAGTMVVGLLSHLMGGNYSKTTAGNDGTHVYPWGIECCANGNPASSTCTGCSGRFAAFMGIGTTAARPSPDPFAENLAPDKSKYCR